MNKPSSFVLLAMLAFSGICKVQAQDMDNPGNYIASIGNAQTQMNKAYMSYISTLAHSRRAKKIEKMRQQTLEAIENCRFKIIEVPIYKGDNSLRKSSIDYVQLCYKVFNEDYAHIVDIGEIAEQSFDEMQAYILLQEKTSEKLSLAADSMSKALSAFATKYNVTLHEEKTELGTKMEKAGKLNHYHNQLYLLFFKCNWQDNQLTEAMNKKKVNDVEQARSALASYAKEGIAALDSLKTFGGDASLAQACRKALTQYRQIAEEEVGKLTDFLMKEEEFAKLKKAFDAKGNNRTQEDVDGYNKAVNQMNAAVNTFNKVNNTVNNNRNELINQWVNTEKTFIDAHTPHY